MSKRIKMNRSLIGIFISVFFVKFNNTGYILTFRTIEAHTKEIVDNS